MLNNQKELILLEELGMQYATATSKRKHRYGLYKCHCGNSFKTQTSSVKCGFIKSCGCDKNSKHNLSKHRLYGIWSNLLARFKEHSEITICKEWLNIENFIKDVDFDYKEGLCFSLKENEKIYNKQNYIWTSQSKIQSKLTKLKKTNTSGYRGVSYIKSRKIYASQIVVNKKNKYIGNFDTAIEAAIAYDDYVIANNLEHTRNFS